MIDIEAKVDVNELLDQVKERRVEFKERRPFGPFFERE
jgi:hypothetical protein